MKTTVTFQNTISHRDYDIQIDDGQRLKTTLQVLRENLPGALSGLEEPVQVQSCRSRRRLSPEKTYREERIFNGDILLLSGDAGKREIGHDE